MNKLFVSACERACAQQNKIDTLLAALSEIADLQARPAPPYPEDWQEQIAACPDCQRYKNHPIQRGICDQHRKPIYAQERHRDHEERALGYRAKSIARDALDKVRTN